ncbi:MAG: histidine phosphatase family protein [Clostridium sp.]|nr:histidine phosphatase family protein [Clostridium sp.]
MTRLYITRHGETKWNREKRFQGWKNSPLTEKGVLDGKKLNEIVKEKKIDKIYTSPLKRAYETATYAKGDKDIDLIVLDELREINMGSWEGRTIKDIKKVESENYYNYWNDPFKFIENSGESFKSFLDRAESALDIITNNSKKDENILVVTHGVTLKAIISKITREDFLDYWRKPVLKQCSISEIEIKDNKAHEIIRYGDVSHLID